MNLWRDLYTVSVVISDPPARSYFSKQRAGTVFMNLNKSVQDPEIFLDLTNILDHQPLVSLQYAACTRSGDT